MNLLQYLKIRKLHIKKKSLFLASLEKSQKPSWQQWAEAESKLHLRGIHLDLGWGGLFSWSQYPTLPMFTSSPVHSLLLLALLLLALSCDLLYSEKGPLLRAQKSGF